MQALEEYYGRDGDGYRVDVDACLANLRRELDRQSKVPDVQEIKRLRSERANLTSLTAYQSGFISAEGCACSFHSGRTVMALTAPQQSEKAIEAAKVLRAQIANLAGGDEDFIRDSLEGEVDFDQIVRTLVTSIGEDEAMVNGLKAYVADLNDRKDRIETRIGHKRTLITLALEIAGCAKLEVDVATISLTKIHSRALVTEEADIPSEFWKPQAPKLDKTALNTALRDGRTVAGAVLDNGGTTCTIRRK
jgi:hypothetical protein